MNQQVNQQHPSIGSTVLGYPRIGRNRELKLALEQFWKGDDDGTQLEEVGRQVRRDSWQTMTKAGLESVPVNTFSWYDHVLDTAVLVGAVPERFRDVSGTHQLDGFDAARYFAMARGVKGVAPLEMTKWFDTNYHYLVPEVGPTTTFQLNAAKPLGELVEAEGVAQPRPVVVGPWTFLSLAKASEDAPAGFDPRERLADLVPVYADLLAQLAGVGARWVQLDEPSLVGELSPSEVEAVRALYEELGSLRDRPAILVSTYFAAPVEALPALASTPVEAIGLDLVRGLDIEEIAGVPGLKEKTLVLGLVDGRNVWRTDLRMARMLGQEWERFGAEVAVSTSCSLLHVPYDVSTEERLAPALRATLAFADQKLAEVVAIHESLGAGPTQHHVAAAMAEWDDCVERRADIEGLHRPAVRERLEQVTQADRTRVPRSERMGAQSERLDLPMLPTTTIGSFPQTAQVRRARGDLRKGLIDEATYDERMRVEIDEVVALQERLGLDVLVHGEPERNDMVQYFAEALEGYTSTIHGWVQSYGSRCVRPPILFGDVERSRPITVPWSAYAQSLTAKPVKAMLTGPVTMLAWSFVRDDQPESLTADQVALALRDEVADLEEAGLAIIQVDEPALRELLPIRVSERQAYLDWSVAAFRLATAGVADATQIHTHLCYSEFGQILPAIDALDADVTSIEAARSRMELLADIEARGFHGAIGPGVYDIHSPRVPTETEIARLLVIALRHLPAERLWVNPDCGLKTRGYDEVEPALAAMVGAAQAARAWATEGDPVPA